MPEHPGSGDGLDLTVGGGYSPPTVTAIHIAPGARLPMHAVSSVEVEAELGIVGDRYHGTRRRQVTVQSRTALEAAARDLGTPVPAHGTRRNITVSCGELPTRPGARVRLGEVDLEVVREAAPCRLLDDAIGPGACAALRGRAGTAFRARSSGTVRLGDLVDLSESGPAG